MLFRLRPNQLEIVADQLLGPFDVERIQKGQLEAEGFEKDHQMLGNTVGIALDHFTSGYTKTQKTFEKDMELGGTTKDDVGEIGTLFLELQHDIHQ
jgi:hypothetical protein